ncbi:MerR family transcriptional regulator [Terrarubrum flagellatum]|uniref:MerR family transcriptional regulator n=1 Tax=Terrirubrum flagellatum TaxID=2895980 RepID=UPI0031450334
MNASAEFLNSSEAAKRLGVSAKALRLYEQRGLIRPVRTAAGWRAYGPTEMARAAEIVALRALGLSLAQTARVLEGDAHDLKPALAAHEAALEGRVREIADAIGKVRELRTGLARGEPPTVDDLAQLTRAASEVVVSFELPWPWGGEQFELRDIRALNYIIGPLGSGKTRLAQAIAAYLPGAAFIGLDRADHDAREARERIDLDSALKSRVEKTLAWLIEDGAQESAALIALLAALESKGPTYLVIDMIEQGLDQATQEALIAHLRRRDASPPSLFFLTRSSAILDLAAVGPDEAIIFCPANHSPPMRVAPVPGAPGYEAVAMCLASPDVRARTEGTVAVRAKVA